MNELKSHPDLFLHEHISSVRMSVEAIMSGHSDALSTRWPALRRWLDQAVLFHDVGKASLAFQQYIIAPALFKGPREKKAHTPLSMLIALRALGDGHAGMPERLAVSAAVGCHHSGFRVRDELEHVFASTTNIEVLAEQLRSFLWAEASEAVGVALQAIMPEEEPWVRALDDLEELGEYIDGLTLDEAVLFRLKVQFVLSALLEADKAFLAINPEYLETYLNRKSASLESGIVERFLSLKPDTPLNQLRQQARGMVLDKLAQLPNSRIFSVTLPTGTGKTMLAACWALHLRNRFSEKGISPKIIIVLPYLSIIDQTEREYADLLESRIGGSAVQGTRISSELLASSHSLSERTFDAEMDGNTNDFYIDTWQSEIIITTFDQFLFALMAPSARHQMRFHNLCDALVIMDEIQTLPCVLWEPLNAALSQLARMGNTHILVMSATQPGFLQEAAELVTEPKALFSRFHRYQLELHHHAPMSLASFIEQIVECSVDWVNARVLITLNTRNSARAVRDALSKAEVKPLYFLSADVTPKDRLKALSGIRAGGPCIVVSTQCIEAGVDIDMDLVIRDMAPLDSLLQVAGRCNRNGIKSRSNVRIFSLTNEKGRYYAEMIYDAPLLQATQKVLGERTLICEEDVYSLSCKYFEELRKERNTGHNVASDWARWRPVDPVRHLLRGKQSRQETFIVVEGDPELPLLIAEAEHLEDRWERRSRFRFLASRIARVSVTIYARPDLDPSKYAAARGPFDNCWLLKEGFYCPKRGLDLGRSDEEEVWGIIV